MSVNKILQTIAASPKSLLRSGSYLVFSLLYNKINITVCHGHEAQRSTIRRSMLAETQQGSNTRPQMDVDTEKSRLRCRLRVGLGRNSRGLGQGTFTEAPDLKREVQVLGFLGQSPQMFTVTPSAAWQTFKGK